MLNTSRSGLYSFMKSVWSMIRCTFEMSDRISDVSGVPSPLSFASHLLSKYPFTVYRQATKLPLSHVEMKKLGNALRVLTWYQLKR